MSECYVSEPDYRRHWRHEVHVLPPTPIAAPVYLGPDRRRATTDRRAQRERRDHRSNGRRYRVRDRRATYAWTATCTVSHSPAT